MTNTANTRALSVKDDLKHTLTSDTIATRRGIKEFFQHQRMLSRTLPSIRTHLGLGPEYKLLIEMIRRSTPALPWSWVQQGTQAQWAEDWGVSLRTFKRHLLKLQRDGWVSVSVEKVTAPVVRKKDREAYEFPVYRINTAALTEAMYWGSPGHWTTNMDEFLNDNKRRDLRNNTRGYSEISANSEYQLRTGKCQNGTFAENVIPLTAVIIDDTHPYLEDTPEWVDPSDFKVLEISRGDSKRKHPVFSGASPAVGTNNSNSNQQNDGDRVSARHPRRRAGKRLANVVDEGTGMGVRSSRGGYDEDEPAPIGASGDLFGTEGRQRSDDESKSRPRRSTTQLLDHFESQWAAARESSPRVARQVPAYVARGNKAPCLKWFRDEVLKDRSLDEAKALVDTYVKLVFSETTGWKFRPGNPPPVWLHFRSRFVKTLDRLGHWQSEEDKTKARESAREKAVDAARARADLRREWARFEEDRDRLEEREFNRVPVFVDHESPEYAWTLDVGLAESIRGVPYPGDPGKYPAGRMTYRQWLETHPEVVRERYNETIWGQLGVSLKE